MSNWPTHSDYQDAMQNPSVCFADEEAKTGEPKLDMLGLPRVMSGNFASVYELKTPKNRWAIRCFVRQVPGQQGRYARLSQYINNITMSCLVDFEYILKGILVRGEWYPVVKMRWVEGSPLNTWVEENINNADALKKLASDWRGMMKDLAANKVAHGDLQHGNIMVTPDNQLRLVDYDGMYAPVFGRGRAPELGHINFQHPRRTADFYQEDLDNFSALVIYTSLLALAAEPELWQKFYTVDNLIFCSSDFKNPLNSQAFTRLKASKDPQVQKLTALVEKSCLGPVETVPDFLVVMDALDKGTLDALPMKTPSAQTVTFSRPAAEAASSTTGSRPAPAATPTGTRPAPSGTRSAYENVPTVATQPLKKTQTAQPKNPGYVQMPTQEKSGGIPGWVWGIAGALIMGVVVLVIMSRKPAPPPGNHGELNTTPTTEVAQTQIGGQPPPGQNATAPPVANTISPLGPLKGHSGSVDVLSFSPDGKWLASGGPDKSIRVWNVQTGQSKSVLNGSSDSIIGLNFLPDGKRLCSISADNIITFWDLSTGAIQKKVEDFKDNIFPIAYSPALNAIAIRSPTDTKSIIFLDPVSGSVKSSVGGHSPWVKAVNFSADGKLLVSVCHDESVNILDIGSGTILQTVVIPGNSMDLPKFSPDGKMLVTAFDNRAAKIWDVPSTTTRATFTGHSADVKCAAFSPDEKLLATGSADMKVKIWNVNSANEIQTLTSHTGTVGSIAFSPDGKFLASGSADQIVWLYEVKK